MIKVGNTVVSAIQENAHLLTPEERALVENLSTGSVSFEELSQFLSSFLNKLKEQGLVSEGVGLICLDETLEYTILDGWSAVNDEVGEELREGVIPSSSEVEENDSDEYYTPPKFLSRSANGTPKEEGIFLTRFIKGSAIALTGVAILGAYLAYDLTYGGNSAKDSKPRVVQTSKSSSSSSSSSSKPTLPSSSSSNVRSRITTQGGGNAGNTGNEGQESEANNSENTQPETSSNSNSSSAGSSSSESPSNSTPVPSNVASSGEVSIIGPVPAGSVDNEGTVTSGSRSERGSYNSTTVITGELPEDTNPSTETSASEQPTEPSEDTSAVDTPSEGGESDSSTGENNETGGSSSYPTAVNPEG